MESNVEKITLPKFNDGPTDEFSVWLARATSALAAIQALGIADGTEQPPADNADAAIIADFKSRKCKAIHLLVNSLGDRVLKSLLRHIKDPHVMFTKLQTRYASKTTSTKMSLLSEALQLKLSTGSKITDHIAALELAFTKLTAAGHDVPELSQVCILLNSVSAVPEFEATVAAIKTMSENSTTWESVTTRLRDEAQHISSSTSTSSPSTAQLALTHVSGSREEVYEQNRSNNNGNTNRGRRRRNANRNNRRQQQPPSGDQRSQGQGSNAQQQQSKNRTTNNNLPSNFSMPRMAMAVYSEKKDYTMNSAITSTVSKTRMSTEPEFLIDSGASHHMSHDPSLFLNLKGIGKETVSLGDMRKVEFTHSGSIDMFVRASPQGPPTWIRLNNVLLVPALGMNIISVSALNSNRFQIGFSNGCCLINDADRNEVIAAAYQKTDGLYWLSVIIHSQHAMTSGTNHTSDVQDYASAATAVTSSPKQILWHKRLGHSNQEAVNNTLKQKEYKSIDSSPEHITCIDCTTSKGTRGTFDGSLNTLQNPGDCIYVDLCGPMPTTSWGGGRYMMLFIDGASRFIWEEVLKYKSDAAEAIERFVQKFNLQFAHNIRRLHSDNGTEFCNSRVYNFLSNLGIVHTRSAAYNPQSNGLVERANRSMIEKIRCLLKSAKLDGRFWGEAAIFAANTLNVIVKKTLNNKSPHERLFGSPPKLNNFRVFGCKAFIPIPDAQRRKLDDKMRDCILLATGVGSLARVFCSDDQSLHLVRHVRCDESIIPGYGTIQPQGNDAIEEVEIDLSTLAINNNDTQNTTMVDEATEETDWSDEAPFDSEALTYYPKEARRSERIAAIEQAKLGVVRANIPPFSSPSYRHKQKRRSVQRGTLDNRPMNCEFSSDEPYLTNNGPEMYKQQHSRGITYTVDLTVRGVDRGYTSKFFVYLTIGLESLFPGSTVNLAIFNTTSEPLASYHALRRGEQQHFQLRRGVENNRIN